jgi:choline-sulfatase
MTDQQRHDQVGYSSQGHFETPNIDSLASRGAVFECAYSTSTTCVPARVGLLTDLLHHRVPTQVNRFALREGFWTVARALSSVGYETALIGKAHFFPVRANHGFDTMRTVEHLRRDRVEQGEHDDYHEWLVSHGLDDWRDVFSKSGKRRQDEFPWDASVHPTGWIEREAVSFLRARDPSRPLFLVVSFPHPHAPYNPPEPYASMYDPVEAVLPQDTADANSALPPQFREAFATFGKRASPRVDPTNTQVLQRFLTKIRALVRHIDDAIGVILRELDLDRSVVFFTSDHGDYAGHRGSLRKVPWIPFDDLVRVPLLVAGSGVAAGQRVTQVVQSNDFVPTVLELAGLDVPEELDARSLRPFLSGRAADLPDDRAAISATTMGWQMVRRGRLKYIRHQGTGANVLFDVLGDPGETTTLHEDPRYGPSQSELRALLDESLARGIPSLPG